MNKHRVFISFSSLDEDVVALFSDLIKRISLNQIEIWFSNDRDRNGGIGPGKNWYSSILQNLNRSEIVIAFITPNSNQSPWLLYECGFAEAIEDCMVIPVRFGLNLNAIADPFQQKQIMNLSNLKDMITFCDRLLAACGLSFDEEAFLPIINRTLSDMQRLQINLKKVDSETYMDQINRLEKKIDYYFSKMNLETDNSDRQVYDISIDFPEGLSLKTFRKELFTITSGDSVATFLDNVYFELSTIMEHCGSTIHPYMYLEEWVLVEKRTGRFAFLTDIEDWVPAQSVFKEYSSWKIILLDRPLVNPVYKNNEYCLKTYGIPENIENHSR